MAEEIKILAGTATYNGLEHTKNMLATIKSKHPIEQIIIDNGSIDGTPKFCAKFANNNKNNAMCLHRNMGVAYAWNEIIKHALSNPKISYILIAGNDTLLHPDCIDNLANIMQKTNCTLATATNCTEEIDHPRNLKNTKILQTVEITEAPDFSCFMIKTSDILKLAKFEINTECHPGLFDTNFYPAYFEDNDYHYRLQLAGLKAIKTNQAIFYHFMSATKNENPEIAELVNETFLENERYYCRKWGGKPGKETTKQRLIY